ncbi:LysR family transcriptional regulator [Bordetella genomosp. 4]|uniref:LysR family transcriptional regulator n=1 Tax=Bordetella genomosp. 4 TaxID=463044 RepID=UPI000B9E4FD9|nr:LysR family transcriptional regulator [Bordetella genomosp. 4]OZI49429.1 hypothetical protein CAL21_07545 [Bordetella genomosp. 4]
MNLRQLRCFVAAVEQRNVTRAAERLHMAQPALGQHIRALEAELDVSLLDRHSRGVNPTQAGERLYARSLEIIDLVERTQREVAALGKGASQTLTLGLTPSLTLLMGTDLQLAFGEYAAGSHLRLWEEPSFRLATAVEAGELDVALAYDIVPRSALSLTAVMEEEMLFACRPDIAPDAATVDLAYILSRDLALGSSQDIGRRVLAHAAGRTPADLTVRYELQSIAGIRDLLLRGTACSVLPYGSIAHEIKAGRLAGRRIEGGVLKSTLNVVTRATGDGRQPWMDPLFVWLIERAIVMAATRQPSLTTRIGTDFLPSVIQA